MSLRNPIISLPCKGEGERVGEVVVKVTPMTWRHVSFWHTEVQSLIDAHYRHWRSDLPMRDVRADVGWDWTKIYGLHLLHNTACYIPGNKSGPALAMALVVITEDDEEIPIGLITVVPEFECTLDHVSGKRTFAWYLADAPVSFYRNVLNTDPVVSVAAALIDTAIQSGIEAGMDGSLLLHADPNGGQRLANFYLQRCKMKQLSLDSGPLSIFRRKNLDQYFYMSAAVAAAFSDDFDCRR